jgi:hypothetical protein
MNDARWINRRQVQDAIKREGDRMEKAAMYAISQVAFAVERQAKMNAMNGTRKRVVTTNANGKRVIRYDPPRHIGPKGQGPNRVTGALVRSIHTEIRQGFGNYVAQVFPTMIYARAVEVKYDYPYLRPAAEQVEKRASEIFTRAFRRKWSSQ